MIPNQEISLPKYLIIITGPTAVGKTSAAIFIAKQLSTEIISADSRQFYKEMKIGTAVPSPNEISTVPHHLIGNLSIHDYYNVFKFENDALRIIEDLFQTKNTVVLVGGSGLYIDTISNGIDLMPDADMEIRDQLNLTYALHGIVPLREQLKLLDPQSYEALDIANPKRIIRALEVCTTTGHPYSSLLKKQVSKRHFKIIKIGLKRERDELYSIINRRVDTMIENGLENEAHDLYKYRDLIALNTVGYREIFTYFDGKCTLDEAIEKIKVNTRRYAKKQITWFSRDKEIKWFHPSDLPEILNYIQNQIQ
jgi:tRNA dimethylallyltransferase